MKVEKLRGFICLKVYFYCHFERSREVFDLSRSRLRSTTAKTHNLSLIIQNPLLLRVPQQSLYFRWLSGAEATFTTRSFDSAQSPLFCHPERSEGSKKRCLLRRHDKKILKSSMTKNFVLMTSD
jgi:hypothetical protein